MRWRPNKITEMFGIATACLLFAGCAPFKVNIGSYTEGRVVSKENGQPVAGASVMYKGHASTTVVTDSEGRFALDRETVTKWLPLLPIDYFGWQWHPLKVRADGFKDCTFEQSRETFAKPLLVELVPSKGQQGLTMRYSDPWRPYPGRWPISP